MFEFSAAEGGLAVTIILHALAGAFWAGKASNRLTALERDAKDAKRSAPDKAAIEARLDALEEDRKAARELPALLSGLTASVADLKDRFGSLETKIDNLRATRRAQA